MGAFAIAMGGDTWARALFTLPCALPLGASRFRWRAEPPSCSGFVVRVPPSSPRVRSTHSPASRETKPSRRRMARPMPQSSSESGAEVVPAPDGDENGAVGHALPVGQSLP